MKKLPIEIAERLDRASEKVGEALRSYFAVSDDDISVLLDAEKYSLFSGGKRIRPFLTLEFCRLFGGDEKAALPFACAVEMIHTYSLIHDDLPCMDNDDMRRGKPSCHAKFGEANALLAGDALLTYAFGVCASDSEVSSSSACEAVRLLSEAAGSFGMVGGQVIDLFGDSHELDYNKLKKLHSMKTGALIKVAARLGCIAANALPGDERFVSADNYASRVGLAYQITDDVLDSDGTDDGKTTFMNFFDKDTALNRARELSNEAAAAIEKYNDSDCLRGFAMWLPERQV